MFNLFKKLKEQGDEEIDYSRTCDACGYTFSKFTGEKRNIYLWESNLWEILWFCKNHIPNWDYAKQEEKNYRKHSENGSDCYKRECSKKHLKRYTKEKRIILEDAYYIKLFFVYYKKRVKDKKIEPKYGNV